ncbi:MAG: hypothetical protein AAFZ15_19400 [Bacteroidota bacterium]
MGKNEESPVNQRVAEIFREKKVRQIDFCKGTGFSEKNLSNLLTGKVKNTSPDFFVAFAQYFPDVNLRWLFLGQGQKYMSETEMENSKNMSAAERQNLMAIIGEKDVKLIGNQRQIDEVYQSLVELARIIEGLPVMQTNQEEWRHLKEKMEEGLRKLLE